jgi:hypothetical protein
MLRMTEALDVFGRVVMAEFIGALVRDLPNFPNGTPALSVFAAVLNRGADAVPNGYGRCFAREVHGVLVRRFLDRDVVEEAMSAFVTTAIRGKVYIGAGAPLAAARRYVLASAANAAKNVLRTRSRRRRPEVPLELEPREGLPRRELVDLATIAQEGRMALVIDARRTLARLNRGQRAAIERAV